MYTDEIYLVLSHLGSQSNYNGLLLSEGRFHAFNLLIISESVLSHLGGQSNYIELLLSEGNF